MVIRAVTFDLDGTLLDSLADIAHAANAVLGDLELPTHPEDAYRRFIGDGVAMLFRRALPADSLEVALVDRCVADFRGVYAQTWDARTRPYDGIPELLDALTTRGVALAILSNKPDDFTHKCAGRFLDRWPFRAVIGQREGVPPKPDPAGAIEIARRLEIPAGQFLYLGDTAVDMQTATGAGMRPIGAAWGFRPVAELWSGGAQAVIEHPGELVDLLDGRPAPRRPEAR